MDLLDPMTLNVFIISRSPSDRTAEIYPESKPGIVVMGEQHDHSSTMTTSITSHTVESKPKSRVLFSSDRYMYIYGSISNS